MNIIHKIISLFAFLFPINAFACLGMPVGRPEWVQTKAAFGLVFISIVLLLTIVSTIINWRSFWRIPLVGYAVMLSLFHLSGPIEINDAACSIMKEQVTHAILAFGITVLILELTIIFKWCKHKGGNPIV